MLGQRGTDVAREAAELVLLDDSFATIVTAVHEGRRIFDDIRKFIRYTMTSNSGEVWVMVLGPLLGMPMPLLPVQILWINLVTDGLPGIALAVVYWRGDDEFDAEARVLFDAAAPHYLSTDGLAILGIVAPDRMDREEA